MTPLLTQTASTLSPQTMARLTKAAHDFEANMLGEMLKPIFDTVDNSKGPFGGGEGEQQWQPMLVAEVAKKIEAGGGLGIAKDVLAQMVQMQEKAQTQRSGHSR